MIEETRIYVVVAGTVEVPVAMIYHGDKTLPDFRKGMRTVIQPAGRQIAQACHVVSKLRHEALMLATDLETLPAAELISVGYQREKFVPATTIILQARDSKEMLHVGLLLVKKKLRLVTFSDINKEAYGLGVMPTTAIAAFATKKQVNGILDYLPLWEGREGV